ncbi:hypothetical protein CARUB_v10020721mg [Capsella rubella]|uniref:RING-type E3 ubiquitin transferase n=1 Tax=Capsella rubella TaxID=81985 RepID=R0I047_9BRAS|nr:E3 ubiquitin-protein ligase SINA-like 2 [Capsella rubella]EOA35514.1 hypothetical protein CARUB_v10020721mg [Capsella rubella]
MVGEASSSRRKRQRVPSVATEGGGEAENGGGGGDVTRSVTLFELDLLDCPVCCHALTAPIFQCDNGHIACSSCCTKMRNQCPVCTLPVGNVRSRIMEKIVEAAIVQCPNAKHGCTEKFSYVKESDHEKKCSFVLCHCPAPNCNYSGVYKDLYAHYYAKHDDSWNQFKCGSYTSAWLLLSDKVLVLQESGDGPLVVVQCLKEPQGVYVTVNCIAPNAPGVGKFSYILSYSYGHETILIEKGEMDRIQKLSFQIPEKSFLLVPNYFQGTRDYLKMKICIRRLKKDEEKADEEEEEDDEEE